MLRTRAEGDTVLVQITDTGTGMTEEARHRCLEPSFSTKDQAGAGLGLDTVFGIVQRHHGALDLKSEAGKGTTFTLRFPIAS